MNVQPSPESILIEAERLVNGDRNESYGPPWVDYGRTVEIFAAITSIDLTVEQAIMFMVAMKLSRQAHLAKRDNLVDACGYLACLQATIDHKQQRRMGVHIADV